MDTSRIIKSAIAQGKSLTYLCNLIGKYRNYLHQVSKKNLNIPPDSLQIIADDLGTTVEYLTWQTDDPLPTGNKNSVSEKLKVILSEDERRLVEDYRSLSRQGQEWIKQSMVAAVTTYKKGYCNPNMESAKIS